jgi:hypothetical protein
MPGLVVVGDVCFERQDTRLVQCPQEQALGNEDEFQVSNVPTPT